MKKAYDPWYDVGGFYNFNITCNESDNCIKEQGSTSPLGNENAISSNKHAGDAVNFQENPSKPNSSPEMVKENLDGTDPQINATVSYDPNDTHTNIISDPVLVGSIIGGLLFLLISITIAFICYCIKNRTPPRRVEENFDFNPRYGDTYYDYMDRQDPNNIEYSEF